jgi:hypothetical protein
MNRSWWILIGLLATVAVVAAFTHRDKAEAQPGVGIPEGFANPTIVVTWLGTEYGRQTCFAVVEVKQQQRVRIKGAGFIPRQKVKLTICEADAPLTEVVPTANKCGAFVVNGVIPAAAPVGQVVSVKAWDAATNKLLAVWPLDIVQRIPG